MTKKVGKSSKAIQRPAKSAGLQTAEIGGVKIRVARSNPKSAKARRIRGAVQAYYGYGGSTPAA